MPLINCEFNFVLNFSEDYIFSSATGITKFATTDTGFYVPVVTLSNQNNAKLLEKFKSGF